MIQVRQARTDERPRVEVFYRENDSFVAIVPSDVVIVAEDGGAVCGVVRLCREDGVLVLRGMHLREDVRRQGIGTRMLRAAEPLIGGRVCFCIPYSHLRAFYGQVGFVEIDPTEAPPFLRERCAAYVRSGLDAILMRRPGKPAAD